MTIRKVIEPETIHGNGNNDEFEGIKVRELNHPFLTFRMKCIVFICFMLLLGGTLFCVGEAEAITTSGWESEKALVEGAGYINGGYGIPSIAFNVTGDGRWTLISGAKYGSFYGYYWDGTKWVSDTSRVSGLGDVGYCSAPALAFNLTGDEKWTLIARNSAGIFFGYSWNGTEWISDSSRVAGLDVIPEKAGLTIIDTLTGDGNCTLISGKDKGTFRGYYWNGTLWVSDPSRVNGLGDVGSYSRVTASFNVTGDENWTLITGNRAGTFSGYYWDGTLWVSDHSRVAGLGDIGGYSAPKMAFDLRSDGKWILISGSEYRDYKDGFMYATANTKTLSPIADASPSHILATTVHINWTYDRTWGHRVEYSTNPDLSDSQWSDWQIDADVVDIKLWNLQPNTTYYYRVYTYVPWNNSYYVKSSINTFTTIPGQAHIYVNPRDSIQGAMDTLLPEGGTVELLPGVHDVHDTIVINRDNVTIQGTNDSEIRSHNSSKDIFTINVDWKGHLSLNNITFNGFKVTSTYGYEWPYHSNSLIRANNVNNLTVESLYDPSSIRNFVNINWGAWGEVANEGLRILNNTIQNSAMTFVFCKNATVAYNTMTGNPHSCYAMAISPGNSYITVHDNLIDHVGTNANIRTESFEGHIYNNTCKGSQIGISARYGTHNTLIENNTITRARDNGIQFYSDRGLKNQTARNNIIYDCPGKGIQIAEIAWARATGTSDVTILNNVIYNCGGDGIGRGSKTESTWILNISNNIITNNTGYGMDLAHENVTETHSYNDLWNNTAGNYYNTSAGTGDISVNPLFADSASGDFHLKSTGGRWNGSEWVYDDVTSPCIDAGDPISYYSNEPEPNGRIINMGAYGNTKEASKSPSPPAITSFVSDYAYWQRLAYPISQFLNGLLCSNCLYITL